MNVWVLEGQYQYESWNTLGVFSSEAAAQNYKEKRAQWLGYDHFAIIEWTVDSVLSELEG